jgi:hypothetical protein
MLRATLLLAYLVLASCGAPPGSSGLGASGTRTASPPPASSSPNAVLVAGDCTGSSTSLSSTPTTARGITLTIPTGWSDHTGEVSGVAALVYIQAPVSYGADNAAFMLVAVPGPRQGSSSREQAIEDAAGQASLGPQSVSDCTLGGESASFYRYQDSAGNDVYRLLVLHCPLTRYPPLYSVVISGHGQVDDRAATDVRGILGSWSWGTNLCNLYN